MIRKYITRTVILLLLCDQFVLVGAMGLALWLKRDLIFPDRALPMKLHVDLFLRLWPFLALVMIFSGAYDLHVAVGRIWPLLRRTLVACVGIAGVWIVGAFYLKMGGLYAYSRGVFTLFLILVTVGAVTLRLVFAEALALWRARTGKYRRVLIFGGERLGRKLIRNLEHQLFTPVRIIGITDEMELRDVPRLTEEEAIQRIRQGEVDHVILDLPPKRIRLLLRVAEAAEIEGVPLQITPSIFPGVHLRPRVDRIGRIPMIELCGGDLSLSGLIAKRALDVGLSSIGLIVLSPLFAVIALSIRLGSAGPVLYTQERVGLDGRRFKMLKFRSMRTDAEAASGPVWATEHDDRTTAIGKLLRRTNMDELPQLFNVLGGSMSLVGPRPERPEFVEQFKPVIDRYSHKHWVKPGITGWAQINGWRGQTDLQRRIEHDIYYIERWSIWFDLKIIFLTVFRGYHNAY